MNLKEQEIWALIENYGDELRNLRAQATCVDFGVKGGNRKQAAVEIVERLGVLVKDLP
jgi:hypothetical protein